MTGRDVLSLPDWSDAGYRAVGPVCPATLGEHRWHWASTTYTYGMLTEQTHRCRDCRQETDRWVPTDGA